jgi:predicted SAM-dependent methyltransferase
MISLEDIANKYSINLLLIRNLSRLSQMTNEQLDSHLNEFIKEGLTKEEIINKINENITILNEINNMINNQMNNMTNIEMQMMQKYMKIVEYLKGNNKSLSIETFEKMFNKIMSFMDEESVIEGNELLLDLLYRITIDV